MPLDAGAVGGALPGALPPPHPEAAELFNHLMYIAPEVTLDESHTWVLAGDTAILSLTLIGAFFIIGRIQWNEYKGRGATTRMRFVESLIFSDVVMGIVGLIGCGLQLNNKLLVSDSPTCNGLGVMMVTVFWSQHLWTLALAVSTFMILVHPLHSLTSAIEKSWYWAWPVVWGISLAIGLIGLFVYGYGPAGGICFYQNNAGLYAELMQFLPRAIVFICIAFLYGKLYIFLKRPDKIRTGFSDPSHSCGSDKHRWSTVRSRTRWFSRGKSTVDGGAGVKSTASVNSRRSHPGPIELPPNAEPPPSPSKLEPRAEPRSQKPNRHSHRRDPSDVPPWERLELPAFQVDGERFGGSEGNDHRLWREWNGFAGRKRNMLTVTSPLTSPSKGVYEPTLTDTVYEGKLSPTASYFPLPSTNASSFGANTPPPLIVDKAVPPSIGSEGTLASPTTTAVESNDGAGGPHRRPSTFSFVSSGTSEPDAARLPSVPNSATTLNEVTELRRDSIPDGTIPFRRASGLAVPVLPGAVPRSRPSLVCIPSAADVHRSSSQHSISRSSQRSVACKDPEKGCVDCEEDGDDDDEDGEDTWDLARMLKEPPPDADRDPFAIQTTTSENVEYVPESLASYLNRKTALLMLWFPLGYVLLFSVSMVRLIYDFSGNPPIELRAISRWMMFGQGLLDAIIYGLVEWHTKRVVRRRVRKGTFSNHNSANSGTGHHSGFGSAMRNLNPLRKHGQGSATASATAQRESRNGTGTATGSALPAGSPTVSFAEPERSILQRLDEREASVTSEGTAKESAKESTQNI